MQASAEHSRYNRLSVVLHWGMLLLLIAVYACMELSDSFPRGSDARHGLQSWHYMLGMAVFFLACLRLAVSLATRRPAIEPALPVWQARLAGLVQAALYLLMIAMPLLGWLILNAKGQALAVFGLSLPVLIAENKNLAGTLKALHETGATLGYVLLGLHAGAALLHHYVVHDNTLQRMWWGRR